MAMSNPELLAADIPREAPPSNSFTVSAKVQQGGPDPVASEDHCVTRKLDISGWKTPVQLLVDGEQVDERELCLAPGAKRSLELSTSLSDPGGHSVKVRVMSVGGNAFDLKDTPHKVSDDITGHITISKDASDPSKTGLVGSLMQAFGPLADSLGATTTQVGIGMALAIVLLVVV